MLIKFNNVDLSFGVHPLLKQANLSIKNGDKVCLIGRNGCGKTSLLKLITSVYQVDDGEIWLKDGIKIGVLEQNIPPASDMSVFEFIICALDEIGKLLNTYNQLIKQNDANLLPKISEIQHQIDVLNGWQIEQQVKQIISKLNLPADKSMADLSGGWRRRVLLAKALVINPDLLILDEPTNHLDIGAIIWLENVIKNFAGTIIMVTHDRKFLQNTANHIVELDRGQLISWRGDYQSFTIHKDEQLKAEQTSNELFDKKLALEETWIRQGIKARRTRNEGRVRKLEAMRVERKSRIDLQVATKIIINQADKSGKQVIEAQNVNFAFDQNKPLIKDFNLVISRGMRLGLLGANGCGKTTLLKILLGEIKPCSGQVNIGTKLKVAYFDQMRSMLNPEHSVLDNIAEGRDFVEVNGKERHVISYLADFLFESQRVRTPVKALSGGEIARLCLAKLFTHEANLLVLDEPTNDLDIETLELLEQTLLDCSATVILISHDRSFLNNLVTSTLVFKQNGEIGNYVGGFDDWLRQGGKLSDLSNELISPDIKQNNLTKKNHLEQPIKKLEKAVKQKLSYNLKRELQLLPSEIEQLEGQIAELNQQINSPDFFNQENNITTDILQKLNMMQNLLEEKMARWLELEDLS